MTTKQAHGATDTPAPDPERDALSRAIGASPSYRLAYEDLDFMGVDEMRPLRLQLELSKPEYYLRQHNIHSTIVVFGSARLLPPDQARAQLEALLQRAGGQAGDAALQAGIARARKQLEYARYYDEARSFSEIVSRHFQQHQRRDFVVVTGGGPGIMEAANRGACDAWAHSIGLNITLPREQAPNPFISPGLCFQFHYFALRKMHFLLRAKGLVAFPGGYGTLDELFETLTLVQTGKIEPIPIVLIGERFWRRLIDFEFLVEEGMISRDDLAHFSIVDSADEGGALLRDFYKGVPPAEDK